MAINRENKDVPASKSTGAFCFSFTEIPVMAVRSVFKRKRTTVIKQMSRKAVSESPIAEAGVLGLQVKYAAA